MSTDVGLTADEIRLIHKVLDQHAPGVSARVFGSRAKGTAAPESDVDLALDADVPPLIVARIRGDLEDLPLPYRFDVVAIPRITNPDLVAHIKRVGVRIA